jgi:hypothetical protein
MPIVIRNSLLNAQAVIEKVTSSNVTEAINAEYTFKFSAIIDDEKAQHINTNNVAEVENNYFDIMYTKEQRHEDNTLSVSADCEHVSYRLNDGDNILEEGFTFYGTPNDALVELFTGTPFTIGQVDFLDPITIAINEKVTKRSVLIYITQQLTGELKFNKFEVSILTARGADRGVQFRYRKNNKTISKISDKRSGQLLVAYETDVVELEFADGYDEDEHYELGDTVRVIDPGLNINTPQRIVKESHDPFIRMIGKVIIANFIPNIISKITSLQKNTVIKEKLYNGVRLGPEKGVEATRSDKKVKSTLNATEGISVAKGDGSGANYTNMFYVDIDGNIHMNDAFIEMIGALTTILLNPNVGIKISKGTEDLFYVDESGNLIMDGKLKITDDGDIVLEAFKDTNGGIIKLYDVTGKLNVKIGSESGSGDNVGGTLILYNDVPVGGNPLLYQRVEIGIVDIRDAGIINLRNGNNKIKVQIEANRSLGKAFISLLDDDEFPRTYFSETDGYIDYEKIATEDYVDAVDAAIRAWVSANFAAAGHTHA